MIIMMRMMMLVMYDNVEYEDDGDYHHNNCVLYDVYVNEEYDLNKNICVILLCDVQVCLPHNLYR